VELDESLKDICLLLKERYPPPSITPSDLIYLANTFNLHSGVISEKYPRLARVLAARYQQLRKHDIIIDYFLIRFCYVNEDVGSKTTSVANSRYFAIIVYKGFSHFHISSKYLINSA